VLPWVGDQALDTARLILKSYDIAAELVGPALFVRVSAPSVLTAVSA